MRLQYKIKILLMLILLLPISLNAETVWIENFEANNLNVFTDGGQSNADAVSISSTQASTGTYSIKHNITVAGGYTYVYKPFALAASGLTTTFYERIRFYTDSTFAGNWSDTDTYTIIAGENSSYSQEWSVDLINVSGANEVSAYWDSNGTEENATSSGAAWTNQAWNTLELYYVYSDTVGIVKIWINGSLVINQSGKDTGTANTAYSYFGYYSSSGFTGAIYLDDIVIDSANYIGTGYRIQEGVGIGSLPYF